MILLIGPMADPVLANVCARLAVRTADLVLGLLDTHLRHSHVWFSYGPVFNRLFMSPAHHQIHHSVDPCHWKKNFGVKLSIWDGLFGTHYHPGHPEVRQVGLLDAAPRECETVRSLYVSSAAKSVRNLTQWLGGRP